MPEQNKKILERNKIKTLFYVFYIKCATACLLHLVQALVMIKYIKPDRLE